jgi:hypothetical protein
MTDEFGDLVHTQAGGVIGVGNSPYPRLSLSNGKYGDIILKICTVRSSLYLGTFGRFVCSARILGNLESRFYEA